MQFDYVIAGAGTAGCVLANRLSADPQIKVLLLEAGPRDDWIWIHIPVGYLYCIGNPRTDWCYRTEPDPDLNGRSILYARGKVLGGCSSINAMLYLRGQARDYDEWARLTGDPAWSWSSVLPMFRKSEDYFRGADAVHGTGGEWRVEPQRLSWEILKSYRDAMVQAGIPRSDDFNRGDNEGCGFFMVNQKRGVRWNTAKAFLRPVINRPNLTVITGAHVVRLRMDGRRCNGIEFRRGDEDTFAEARLETILATGSIGSPQIMQLSGLGPAPLLREHGIDVVHELPGVGENLQDHLQLRTVFKVRNAVTLNQRANSVIGKMMMGLEYAFFRTGPLTMAPSQLGGFTRSSSEHAAPNIEFHVQPLSLDKFGDPLHRFPAFTASVCNLRPTSRGFVRIKSLDPLAAPAIQCRYLVHARRPHSRRRRAAPDSSYRSSARARALCTGGISAGRAVPVRRRACSHCRGHRHHDFSSCRHLPDGRNGRCIGGGRFAIARARHFGAPHHRRVDHAHNYLRQYQLTHFDDRGARGRNDPGRTSRPLSMVNNSSGGVMK